MRVQNLKKVYCEIVARRLYKSALIAALLFYCAQGAAIEESPNKKIDEKTFFIAAFLLRRN